MINILNELKKQILSKKYNITRQAYLEKSICNIGKIVEEEDRIVCYVNRTSLDKKTDRKYCTLMLNGMNDVNDKIKATIEKLKLKKP